MLDVLDPHTILTPAQARDLSLPAYRGLLQCFLSRGASLQAAGSSAAPERHDVLAQLLKIQLQLGALGLHVFTHNTRLSWDPAPGGQADELHMERVTVGSLGM